MEFNVIPNKHGYLVTRRYEEHKLEDQAVFGTAQELVHAFRAAGLDEDAISRMRRHLEHGKEFSLRDTELAEEHLFPHRRPT